MARLGRSHSDGHDRDRVAQHDAGPSGLTYATFGPSPWEAVEQLMQAGGRSQGGATFEIDRSRELLLFSMHPRGYLKRVK